MAAKEPASSGRTRKSHISVRVPPRLEEFLREKATKHPGKITGVVEDYLTFAAIAYGYEPESKSPMFDSFATVITNMMVNRLKEEGVIPKGEVK